MTLSLCDLIHLAKIDLGRFKIHLATGPSTNSPLLAYFEGRFKEWQEHQTQPNFKCESVVSLIRLHTDKWLFAGAWRIQSTQKKSDRGNTWYQYSTTEVAGLEHLSGRTIVAFLRTFRASYLQGSRYGDQLVISQMLEDRMTMAGFPGYSAVLISIDELRHIVGRGLEAWRGALKSVAGVYLITDTSSGKVYVGSAYGSEGIWGRWANYANSSHGNNKELKELLQKGGDLKSLQFSILEICDVKTAKDQVLARESHWKNAFYSRKFGYNSN